MHCTTFPSRHILTLRSALVAVALSACGSDAPQQHPDDGVPRLYPGPCESSRGEPFPETCVMTYEEDLLVLTECQSFGDAWPPPASTRTVS